MTCTVFVIVSVCVIVFFTTNFFHMGTFEAFWCTVKNNSVFTFFLLFGNKDRSRKSVKDYPKTKDKVAIVTGGARGIGKLIVLGLVDRGYHVIIAARSVEAGEKLINGLKLDETPGSGEAMKIDLLSMKSVKDFAESVKLKYPKIHLLVNNAGVASRKKLITEDGFESHMSINYLGHFLLTHLLMDNLIAAGKCGFGCSRIVNVSSCMHAAASLDFEDMNMKVHHHPVDAYSKSKLAQLMFTRYLNRNLLENEVPVRIYAAHPGIVGSDMLTETPETRFLGPLKKLFKTIEKGAIPVLHCCLAPELENPGGNYISNCIEGYSTSYSKDVDKQEKLFKLSCDMLNIKRFGADF